MRSGWKRWRSRLRPGRRGTACAPITGLWLHPSATAATPPSDLTVAVGGIPGSEPGWLPLLPICWRSVDQQWSWRENLALTRRLVLDDFCMAPLAETERRDFWEICEERYQTRSTILTSQLPVARWHEQIGDPTAATESSTAWFTTPIASRCVVIRCARNAAERNRRANRGQGCRPFPTPLLR